MIRIVNTAEGSIEVDIDGRLKGRGAYLCKDINCLDEGLKGSRLEHALRTGINREDRIRLLIRIRDYLDEK
jgi:predicted RNA-binding protein YlxR (DUF448 family)